MDIAAIREALHKRPFEPFIISLADGRSLPVPHPDFLAVHPRRVIVVSEDGPWSVVGPLLIASLDYQDRRKKGGDGKTKRGRS